MNETIWVERDERGVLRTIARPAGFADLPRRTREAPVRFETRPCGREAFERHLLDVTEPDTLRRFDAVMDEAEALAARGRAAPAPPREAWRRMLVIGAHHARDMEVVLAVLGIDKALAGVHDLTETALGAHVKASAAGGSPWYRAWAEAQEDDARVGIGMLSPSLCASFYWRSVDPEGPLDGSLAHLLSDHHFGAPDVPVDFVEQAVNWIAHALREHFGIMGRAQRPYAAIDEALANDPLASKSPLLRAIARDVAPVMEALEEGGRIVPWSRLRRDEGQRVGR